MKIDLLADFEFDKAKVVKSLIDLGFDVDSGTGEGNYFRTPYEVNPVANNEEYKYGSAIYVSPEFLSYFYVKNKDRKNGKYVLIPWLKCTFSVSYDKTAKYPQDEKRVRDIVGWVREHIVDKMPYKAFYDEDAYAGNFSWKKKDNARFLEFSFYVNPDYPEGYWENHVL
jgi:hypothetical protein